MTFSTSRAVRTALFSALVAVVALVVAPTAGATASTGDTRECVSAFGPGFVGFKIDDVNENTLNGSYSDPSTGFEVTISNTDTSRHKFDYVSNWPANVIVKGGPSQGELYQPPASSGTGLHPPVNPNNGKFYGISHITFCWAPSGEPKLKFSKFADRYQVVEGETVRFALSVKNLGTASSHDVVISDDVPAGLEIVQVDPPCTVSGQLVTCVAGTVTAGQTVTYKVFVKATLPPATVTTQNEQLNIYKVEKQISMQPGTTVNESITCNPGDLISDAAVRIDHIDQGTGDPDDIEIHRLESNTTGSYQTTVTNHATGQAQLKLFAVCLPGKTTEGRSLTVGAPVTTTVTLEPGVHEIALDCPVGSTPVAPGLNVSGGRVLVLASAPVGDTGRRLTLKVSGASTTVTASIRCLQNRTSELNGVSTYLTFNQVIKPITVGAGSKATESLECGANGKGIVGGWEFEDGLVPLGNDPQPKSRVFYVWNPTAHPLTGTLYLLCLEARTGTTEQVSEKTYVNTATVTTSTPQAPGAVLSDSATVKVTRNTGSAGKSAAPVIYRATLKGRSLVVGLRSATRAGRVLVSLPGQRKAIGKGKFRLNKSGKGKARVKLGQKAARVIRKGKQRVRVKVVSANGKSRVKVVRPRA